MNRTDAPKKQPVPFGVNGSREDLLTTTPAGDNQASYDAGFPPVTMILKAAGGLPPKGQDMNQILYELSDICRWLSAGALSSFDATFSTAIGGYPAGAFLLSDDGSKIFINKTESNTSNPNSGGVGWEELLTFIGVKDASLTQKGIVRLTSSLVSGAEDIAATANAVGLLYAAIQSLQARTGDATLTTPGVVRITDSRTTSSSSIAASSVAAAQNYQDIQTILGNVVSTGRVLGVTYTNTQAMSIFVHVSGIASLGSSFLSASVSGITFTGSQSANLANQRICISFMVPAGESYNVGISGGSLSSLAWVETDKK